HPFIAAAQTALARVAQDKGDSAEARRLFEAALATNEAAVGPTHADTLASMFNLGACLESRKDWAAGLAIYDRIVARCTAPTLSLRSAFAQQSRARCLVPLGRTAEAVTALTGALAVIDEAATRSPDLKNRAARVREELEKVRRGE